MFASNYLEFIEKLTIENRYKEVEFFAKENPSKFIDMYLEAVEYKFKHKVGFSYLEKVYENVIDKIEVSNIN